MEVTHNHLAIYDKYEGEKEHLEERGLEQEKALFGDGDFDKLDEMVEAEFNVLKGTASAEEVKRHRAEVDELVVNEEDKVYLKKLAKKYFSKDENKSWVNYLTDAFESLFDS